MKLEMSRLVAGAAMALFASGAVAGETADRAAEAEALLSAGKATDAVTALDAAIDAFWKTLPLQFRVSLFADSVVASGKYEPRATASFKAGEKATIYLEPVGYGFVTADGLNSVSFSTAVEIRTPGGLILGKTDDFGKLTWSGRSRSHEVHAAIELTLPDLKPGDFELQVTLTDDATGKSAPVTLPFTITE